jgi:uncharacterized protein
MKLMLAFWLAVLALMAPAHAQAPQPAPQAQASTEPSAEAISAANDLLAVMSKDMVVQMTSQMMSQMWPLIESQVSTQVGANGLKEVRSEVERIAGAFTLKAMTAAPPIYASHFSVAELREITAFYKTPTGAKTIAAIPQVMAEFYATLGPRMPELESDLRNAIMDVIAKNPK